MFEKKDDAFEEWFETQDMPIDIALFKTENGFLLKREVTPILKEGARFSWQYLGEKIRELKNSLGKYKFVEELSYGDAVDRTKKDHDEGKLSPKEGFIYESMRHALEVQSLEMGRLNNVLKELVYLEDNPNHFQTLSEKLDRAEEFIKDCAVSHLETRYKYQAQVILNKWSR